MVSTPLKHISQIGSFPQKSRVNIKKYLSCHHLVINGIIWIIWGLQTTDPNISTKHYSPEIYDWNLKSWWVSPKESPFPGAIIFRWTMLNFRGVPTILVASSSYENPSRSSSGWLIPRGGFGLGPVRFGIDGIVKPIGFLVMAPFLLLVWYIYPHEWLSFMVNLFRGHVIMFIFREVICCRDPVTESQVVAIRLRIWRRIPRVTLVGKKTQRNYAILIAQMRCLLYTNRIFQHIQVK